MAKTKTAYVCTECGYDSPKWYGKCPSCGSWNTMAEEIVREEKQRNTVNILAPGGGNRPVRLREITGTEDARFSTGISELDRVLGGGMVKGSMVLVSGARASVNPRCCCRPVGTFARAPACFMLPARNRWPKSNCEQTGLESKVTNC